MVEPVEGINPVETNLHKLTSLSRISRDYNVYFVHKIVPRFVTKEDGWTPLKEGSVDIETLAKVVVATQPEISCSTIEEGDTKDNFLNEDQGIGLLINDGNVSFAGATDAYTNVDKNRVKDGNTDSYYEETIGLTPLARKAVGQEIKTEEDIKRAIQFRRKSTEEVRRYDFTPYNEFVVDNPKVGAVFTVMYDYGTVDKSGKGSNLDDLFRKYDANTNSFSIDDTEKQRTEIAKKLAEELNIPLLVFFKSAFYNIASIKYLDSVDEESRKTRIFLGDKLTIEDALILKDPIAKDPTKRSNLIKQVYKAKPFKDQNVARLMKKP